MKNDAYQTLACDGFVTRQIIQQLKLHRAAGGDQFETPTIPSDPERKLWGIRMLLNGHAEIPPFRHPIVIPEDKSLGYTETIYIDARGCTRQGRDKRYEVTQPFDYKQLIYRAAFQEAVDDKERGIQSLMNLGTFPMTIFIRWVSESLVRRLAIAPEGQMRIAVLVGFYYLCMFRDDPATHEPSTLSEKDLARYATLISRSTYISVADAMDIIKELPVVQDVKGLVGLLQAHSNTTRFDRLTDVVLYSILGGSWTGTGSWEILAVALEHMPTWMAICVMATQEKGLNKRPIGEIVQLYNKGEDIKSFVYHVKHLLET